MSPNSCQTWLLLSRYLWWHGGWPFTQKGEVQENMSLERAAKQLLPRNYGNCYSIAILEQLKVWEAFQMLNIG